MSDKSKILKILEKSPSWWRKYGIIREYFDQIAEGNYTDNLQPLTVIDVKKLSKYINTIHKYDSVKTNKAQGVEPTENTTPRKGVSSSDHHIGVLTQNKRDNADNHISNDTDSNKSDTQVRTEPKSTKPKSTNDETAADKKEDHKSINNGNNKKSKKKKK